MVTLVYHFSPEYKKKTFFFIQNFKLIISALERKDTARHVEYMIKRKLNNDIESYHQNTHRNSHYKITNCAPQLLFEHLFDSAKKVRDNTYSSSKYWMNDAFGQQRRVLLLAQHWV
jgi:hypothetical protein